jgi:phage terminase large subunit-like protein
LAEIVPLLAMKVAVVALARTVTEAGNNRTLAMAPERATEAPPAGAAWVNVTVQVVLALEARVEAVHCREETRTGATRQTVALLEEPFKEAVTVAVWFDAN